MDTNPIDLNKWLTANPEEFFRAAKGLEATAIALEKINKALNVTQSELDETIKKAEGLTFGKDEQELNKLLMQFDKYVKAQKDLQAAQKATRESTQRVTQEQKVQADSIEALTKQAKEYEKEFKKTNDPETLKRFQETNKRLEQQRKALNDARKEARQFAKDVDIAEGSLADLRRELRNLTRRRNNLEIGTEDFDRAQKDVKVLTDRIKGLEMAAGDARRNVGNYAESIKEALAGTQAFGKGFGQAFGGAGGGASGLSAGVLGGLGSVPQLAAIAAVTEGILQIGSAIEEVNQQRLRIGDISGTTGEELNAITAQIFAISDTFKLESREITDAANTLASQLNIGFDEALQQLEASLLGAGASSETVLELIREYPVQFEKAGLSIEETTKILSAAARQGDFFGDKIADSVKEVGLRLREFTPAVRDALTETLGANFAKEIETAVKAGEPAIDLFNKIAKQAKEAGLNTQQLQKLTADIGGGATEDVGGLLRVYEFLNETLSDTNTEFTALQKKQQEQLNLQKEYNEELVRFTESFDGIGQSLSNLSTQILTGLLVGINELIEGFGQLSESIIVAFETVEERQARFEGKVVEFRQKRVAEIKKLNEEETRAEINRINKLVEKENFESLERIRLLKKDIELFGKLDEELVKNRTKLIEEQQKELESSTLFKTRQVELNALNKRLAELTGETEKATAKTQAQANADKKAADAIKKRNEALEEAIRLANEQLEISARFDEAFLRDQLRGILEGSPADPFAIDVDLPEDTQEEDRLRERNNTLSRLESSFRRERLKNSLDASKTQAEIEARNTELLKEELDQRVELLKKFDGFSEELLETQAQRKALDRQEEQKRIDEQNAAIVNGAQLTADLVSEIFANQFARRQELEAEKFNFVNEAFERELEAAEGNEFVQNEIRERQEAAEKKFLEDQARREKNQAIFQASLNAALALGRAFVTGDFLSAIAAAAQLAIVIATPVPSFEKGTDNAPEGTAELAEAGREIIEEPSGKMMIAEKRGLYHLKKGSKVYTNAQTEEMLRQNKSIENQTSYINEYNDRTLDLTELLYKTDRVEAAIKGLKMRVNQTNITKAGIEKISKDMALHQAWISNNT